MLYPEKKFYYDNFPGVGEKELFMGFITQMVNFFSGVCQVLGPNRKPRVENWGTGSK